MDDQQGVWIVQQDETPDNTVLGVFLDAEEAEEYSGKVERQFPDGVIYAFFPFGYRYFSKDYTDALGS